MEFDFAPCTELYPGWPLDPLISKGTFLGMGYMFGQFVGSFIIGIVSDKIGRRHSMAVFIALTAIVNFGGSFAESFWLYFFLRLLAGGLSKGLFVPAFTIPLEVVAPEWRMILGIFINVSSTTSHAQYAMAIKESTATYSLFFFRSLTLSVRCWWLSSPTFFRTGRTSK